MFVAVDTSKDGLIQKDEIVLNKKQAGLKKDEDESSEDEEEQVDQSEVTTFITILAEKITNQNLDYDKFIDLLELNKHERTQMDAFFSTFDSKAWY